MILPLDFLTFSGGIEMRHWTKMGQEQKANLYAIVFLLFATLSAQFT